MGKQVLVHVWSH